MQKILFLVISILVVSLMSAQNKKINPEKGIREAEVSLFIFQDNHSDELAGNYTAVGAEFNYRWPLKHNTKIGGGSLIAAEIVANYVPNKNVLWYGALYGDITQFLGERQKWSVTGRVGHGIYNQETEFDGTNEKGFFKYTAGMYYSLLLNYRAIISQNNLIVIALFWNLRNLRFRSVTEYNSPASTERFEEVEKHTGLGIKLGVIF
jgi:hypothetical protein